MKVLPFGWSLGRFVRFQKLVEPLRVIDRRRFARGGLARTVEASVHGDPVEPGRHGRLTAKGVGGPECGDEGVLYRVSSFLAVAEGAERHGPEPVTVSSHELTEGVRFACDMLRQEILVAGVGESGVVQR